MKIKEYDRENTKIKKKLYFEKMAMIKRIKIKV